MFSLVLLAATTTGSPSSSAWTAYKPAVRSAVLTRFGRNTHIDSILIKGDYALVHGKGFHTVLTRAGTSWNVACDLKLAAVTSATLESRCGIPSTIAPQLAAEEPANMLAGGGEFTAAISAEQTAYASASGPQREMDRLRLQQLRVLNQQMQLQQISREQAIQQWNELRISWALP